MIRRKKIRLLRPFMRPVQCFDVNGKKKPSMSGVLFAFNTCTGKKYVWRSGLQTRFLPWKTAVVAKQSEAASRLSAIHHSYSRSIGAQTVNIQFALVSFSCFFWAKKTPHVCSTPMSTSPNDTESINGMVSDYWNIYCEVEIIYIWYILALTTACTEKSVLHSLVIYSLLPAIFSSRAAVQSTQPCTQQEAKKTPHVCSTYVDIYVDIM